ncbi:MAG: hypothetical protein Q9205_005335 [Flavoplaca limonia]
MSDSLPSSTSSTSSRVAAWLASNPPRGHSRRRSESEALVVLQDSRRSSRTFSPPPAKRRCVAQIKSAPASPTCNPVSSNLPILPTLPISTAPPTTFETPKPAQPQRKPQSYVKRRAKHIIRIIDATYAVCEGKPARSPAFPVHQIQQDLFYVPANYSDFRSLRQYQNRTNAFQALTTFGRSAVIPGSVKSTSCIAVRMPKPAHEALKPCLPTIIYSLTQARWTLNNQPVQYLDNANACKLVSIWYKGRPANVLACTLTLRENGVDRSVNPSPDGSIWVKDATFPFLVMEIANTQSSASLRAKVHDWAQVSRSHLKLIVSLKIEGKASTGWKVLASVTRLRKQASPTPNDPDRYVMVQDRLIDEEEIYPAATMATFTISRSDMLPKGMEHDTTGPVNPVNISLNQWSAHALTAVIYLANQAPPPSPRSERQGSVTPPYSDPEPEPPSEGSDNDRPDDKTYKGKGIDRDGSRGSGVR